MSDFRPILEAGGASDVGCVRKVNEDAFLVRSGSGLWVVSDGMGGHEAGRLASSLVVEALESVEPHDGAPALLADCRRRLSLANMRLKRIALDRGYDIVGATVAVLLIHGTDYACLWSGDSRIYRLRGETIEQLTRDHSEVEELVGRGLLTREEARRWPRRNVITRAIGVADQPEIDMVDGRIQEGDVFVLCSDGLTNHMDDEDIRAIAADRGHDAQAACDRLIATTLERGAKDNVTAVVVRARSREPTVIDPAGSLRANWASPS